MATITQPYGPTTDTSEPPYDGYAHFHQGVDIAGSNGDPVIAPEGGTVVSNTLGETGYGPNLVLVKMANGLIQLFGHMSTSSVRPGDTVTAGEQIGTVGSLGNSTGPHLHYGVLTSTGAPVNPVPYLTGTPNTSSIGSVAPKLQIVGQTKSSTPVVTGVQNAVSFAGGFFGNIFGDAARIFLAILAIIALFIGLYILFRPSDMPSVGDIATTAGKAALA